MRGGGFMASIVSTFVVIWRVGDHFVWITGI